MVWIIGGMFVVVVVLWWNSLRMDKKDWNAGACPCGKGQWESFDTDSSGATGYQCPECQRTIWIGYDL